MDNLVDKKRFLTAAFVKNVRHKGGYGPDKYGDHHGLILRVLMTGGKQWIWRGTIHGKRVDLGSGCGQDLLAQNRSVPSLVWLGKGWREAETILNYFRRNHGVGQARAILAKDLNSTLSASITISRSSLVSRSSIPTAETVSTSMLESGSGREEIVAELSANW